MYLDAAQIDASNRTNRSNRIKIFQKKYDFDFLMLKYYDVLIFVLDVLNI
jgi:hypothetical protein